MYPELEEVAAIGPMFIDAISLFRDSVSAYADANVTLARSLRMRDREIDQMNHDIANDVTRIMAKRPKKSRVT